MAHPDIFLDQEEINAIKARKDVEPWKTAYNSLINNANTALNTPLQSVTFGGKIPPSNDKHDYWVDVPGTGADRTDYDALKKMGRDSIKYLGIAYVLTSDTRYADKTRDLINAWSINPVTKMDPWFTNFPNEPERNRQVRIDLSQNMSVIFAGADYIWNYAGWNQTDKDAFKTWASQLIASAMQWCSCNNYEDWRMVFIGAAASLIEDNTTLTWVFDRFKELINGNFICGNNNYPDSAITDKGEMRYEMLASACSGAEPPCPGRRNALTYSLFALDGFVHVAEIARHHPELGYDLYSYKNTSGIGLEKALDFYAPYATDPAKWIADGYCQSSAYNGENAALYELAYARYGKQTYKGPIDKWGRPMYEFYCMGPTTLMYGDVISTPKYKCSGSPNYECVQDPNGPYNSLTECRTACCQQKLQQVLQANNDVKVLNAEIIQLENGITVKKTELVAMESVLSAKSQLLQAKIINLD